MMVVLALLLLTLFVSEQLQTDLKEWKDFKAKHGKVYTNFKEEQFRQRVFIENKAKIDAHNELYKSGEVSYKMGVNKFSDMTRKEFLRTMLPSHFIKNKQRPKPKDVKIFQSQNVDLPDSVDWRTEGYVTEVKDQGMCGSCWAFSTTGSLEGQHFKSTGKLVSLSEQNLVDCATDKYGNYGCGGGFQEGAMQYVIDNDGIDTEKSYPYTGEDDDCQFKKKNVGATATGYVQLKSGDENALKEATATVGPITVSIDASGDGFSSYESGVYYDKSCLRANDSLDHGVLVVGYGTQDNGEDYWIVKNSWSATWGANGYILMARNRKNNCGIATDALYPTV